MMVLLMTGFFLSQIGFAGESDIIEAAKSGNKDVLFTRPEIVEINPSLCAQYAGLYAPPEGPQLEIHLEDNRLYYYAYGKDELLPISETRFITSAEVKYFEFIRDQEGNITEVVAGLGNDKVRLKKIKSHSPL